MKLLYTEHSLWEFDFIKNDIFHTIPIEVEMINRTNLNTLLDRTDIIENCVIVANDIFNFNDLLTVVKYIKPIAIFYSSDETGKQPFITELDKYTKFFFRQYNHKHYRYSKNNYQFPLGYATNYLNGKNSSSIVPRLMKDRTINCSFIGSNKSDREHMANVFRHHMSNTNIIFVNNNWNISDLPYSPEKCYNIYNDSIFIVNGRGNCSLDCFRIYEAIVAGAIPIIVGSYDEIQTTFHYNNDIPPFIYDESWEKVVVKCNNLLADSASLQKIQDELLLWWKRQTEFIVHSIIGVSS
jgi:hypothetical protein